MGTAVGEYIRHSAYRRSQIHKRNVPTRTMLGNLDVKQSNAAQEAKQQLDSA